MLPVLDLGFAAVPTAGLIYILGAWLALSAVEKGAALLKQHVAATYTLAVLGLAAAFVGARAAFVASHWEAYRQQPLAIVWPLTAGFDIWAGLLLGALAAFFYGRARGLPPWRTLDALAPGLLVGLSTLSLADFLAGPGYGEAADLPWSISLFGVSRHPVQLYEIAFALLALGVWRLALIRGRDLPSRAGVPFLTAGAVYSAGRLFVDAFRDNAWLTQGGYHVVQIISLVMLLACLFFLLMRLESNAPALHAERRVDGAEGMPPEMPERRTG